MSRKKKPVPSPVKAFVAGAILFGILQFILGSFFWPAIAAGALFVVGLFLFAPRKKPLAVNLSGADASMVREALEEGNRKLAALQQAVLKIARREVRLQATEIVNVAQKILADLEKDPGDVRQARQFLGYYLDSTLKILQKYAELSAGPPSTDPEAAAVLNRVEENLMLIAEAFRKQHAKLKENDLLDLDTEIKVLEKTIKLEG